VDAEFEGKDGVTNFLTPNRIVDPGVDYFYLGNLLGATHNKMKLWVHHCPAPTAATAEYSFVSVQDDYVAFLHTDDTKPTLLQYLDDAHYNANKALDCVSATHYGAVAWTDGTKELIVNATKQVNGVHLDDIVYQGTVDFVNAWAGLSVDPVEIGDIIPSDIRIDADNHCSLLQRNDYYVSEISVADDLSLTLAQNVLKTNYDAGAEHACAQVTIGISSGLISGGAVFCCNYEPDAVGAIVFQYSTSVTGPWTDVFPDTQEWTQRYSVAGTVGDIQGSVAHDSFPIPGTPDYLYVRAKTTYGTKTFYGVVSRLQWYYGWRWSDAGESYWPHITGNRITAYRSRFGGSGVLVREIVANWNDVGVIDDTPWATSYVMRIVERSWADFWGTPTVIVSESAYAENDTGYNAFVSAVFADGSIGITYELSGVPHLFVFTTSWTEITLPALPTGYTYVELGPLVELPQRCFVVIVVDGAYNSAIAVYDITAGTWSIQTSAAFSGFGSFNTDGTKLFFTTDDGLWHCTSVLAPSNAVWFFQI
jgi:hypothetical protein